MVARWVTDGVDRCIVGRVGNINKQCFQILQGRLAQVTELLSESRHDNKKLFSNEHGGVCFAVLVDKYIPGDELLDHSMDIFDSDSDTTGSS